MNWAPTRTAAPKSTWGFEPPAMAGVDKRCERPNPSLGEKLFNRVGRRLALTEAGRVAFRYADEIFTLGRELMDTIRGRPTGRPLPLAVGVADASHERFYAITVERRLKNPAVAAISEAARERLFG